MSIKMLYLKNIINSIQKHFFFHCLRTLRIFQKTKSKIIAHILGTNEALLYKIFDRMTVTQQESYVQITHFYSAPAELSCVIFESRLAQSDSCS